MDKIKIWPRDGITFISEDGEGWSGTKRHSGRYPYGHGEHPYQHEPWFKGFGEGAQETVEFYDRAKNWKKQFATTAEAAKFFKMTDNEFRKELSFASNRVREMKRQKVSMLLEQNPEFTDVQIGKYLGISPSTVRNYRKEKESARTRKINQKIDELQKFVDENKYVDIGPGTEIGLGVTRSTLDTNIVAELERRVIKGSRFGLSSLEQTENLQTLQFLLLLELITKSCMRIVFRLRTRLSIERSMRTVIPLSTTRLQSLLI